MDNTRTTAEAQPEDLQAARTRLDAAMHDELLAVEQWALVSRDPAVPREVVAAATERMDVARTAFRALIDRVEG